MSDNKVIEQALKDFAESGIVEEVLEDYDFVVDGIELEQGLEITAFDAGSFDRYVKHTTDFQGFVEHEYNEEDEEGTAVDEEGRTEKQVADGLAETLYYDYENYSYELTYNYNSFLMDAFSQFVFVDNEEKYKLEEFDIDFSFRLYPYVSEDTYNAEDLIDFANDLR